MIQVGTASQSVGKVYPQKDCLAITLLAHIISIEGGCGFGVTRPRNNPEESFAGQQRETPWNDIHVVYFVGEAFWAYLNTPFLYTSEGFTTDEIPSIEVEGEIWRRLKVTFPPSVKSHTKVRVSCFGPEGLLRRHYYTVDILGGATGLNYALDYRDVDGIIVPTKRRVQGMKAITSQ